MARTGRPTGQKNATGHSAGRPRAAKKADPSQTTLFQTMRKQGDILESNIDCQISEVNLMHF